MGEEEETNTPMRSGQPWQSVTRSAPASQRNDEENEPSNGVNGGSETEPAVSPLA